MLDAGDVVDGDVVVFGGNLQAAAGSRIDGDVVVFGGRIEIDGEVRGDVAAIGGGVRLGSSASISGKVISVGGSVARDEGAEVGGGISEVTKFDFGWSFPAPTKFVDARPPQLTGFDFFEGFFQIVRALLLAVVLAVIGLLVVLFLPDHTQVVGGAIRDAGPASFGVGLLTFVVGLAVITLLAIYLLPVAGGAAAGPGADGGRSLRVGCRRISVGRATSSLVPEGQGEADTSRLGAGRGLHHYSVAAGAGGFGPSSVPGICLLAAGCGAVVGGCLGGPGSGGAHPVWDAVLHGSGTGGTRVPSRASRSGRSRRRCGRSE